MRSSFIVGISSVTGNGVRIKWRWHEFDEQGDEIKTIKLRRVAISGIEEAHYIEWPSY